jgi:hypothetical protein
MTVSCKGEIESNMRLQRGGIKRESLGGQEDERENKARAKVKERTCWREVALFGQGTRESAASSTGSFGAQLRPGRYGIRSSANYTVFVALSHRCNFGARLLEISGEGCCNRPKASMDSGSPACC